MSFPPTPIPGRPGAIGLNAQWQIGLAPRPLVQEQGTAGDDLLSQSGSQPGPSHTPRVETDWQQIDWMRAYLLDTGEFPGNGNTTPGNNFFDMMNGMASFTRGTRAIAQAPAWNAVYASKVAEETSVYDSICQWLMSTDVKALGDAYNAPDTHRRWMNSATLRQTAWLLRQQGGGTNAHADAYDADALAYENDGLSLQKGPGWMLALYPPFVSGTFRPGRLYLPPDPPPAYFDGTASTSQVYGEGVRPEQGDNDNETWDAIYNPNGDKLAVWGVAVQPAGAHREACSRAVDVSLFCCMQFLTAARDNQGVPVIITPNGSGRVGSIDIHGNPKKIDPKAWRFIFQVQAGLAPDSALYGGSSDPNARAAFASVYSWLDGVIRNPNAAIPVPPTCPASLYPTITPPANTVTKTLKAVGAGGTTVKQVTVTQGS